MNEKPSWGEEEAKQAALVNPPVERASTLLLREAADFRRSGRVYGRDGMATQDALAAEVAKLEGAASSVLVPSGLAACTFAIAAHVQSGDHVLVSAGAYLPVRRFCQHTLTAMGVETTFYDPRLGAGIAGLIRPETKILYTEQPSSLSFEFQDLPAIVEAARQAGILTICDHSWGGGYAVKPLALGVDITALALTKYPSGCSDVFLGAISTSDKALGAKTERFIRSFGASVSPDDAYLVLRGMRSLETRMAQHERTGLALAQWCAAQPQIKRVLHPGLPDSPDHALWARDCGRASGLFAVILARSDEQAALRMLDALNVFGLGYSFGGFESLAMFSDPQLEARGDALQNEGSVIRLAAGLEPLDALIADLEQALALY